MNANFLLVHQFPSLEDNLFSLFLSRGGGGGGNKSVTFHRSIYNPVKLALREGFEPSGGESPTSSQGWRRGPSLATSACTLAQTKTKVKEKGFGLRMVAR